MSIEPKETHDDGLDFLTPVAEMGDEGAALLRELGDWEGADVLEGTLLHDDAMSFEIEAPRSTRGGAVRSGTRSASFDPRTALSVESTRGGGLFSRMFGGIKPWQHTSYLLGYLGQGGLSGNMLAIVNPRSLSADTTLRGGRVNISFDRLHVQNYPGAGTHEVLCVFSARHSSPHGNDWLHFTATQRARAGQQSGLAGIPLFVGLPVGSNGVEIKCSTVTVSSSSGQGAMDFFNSPVFQSGVDLAKGFVPSIGVASEGILQIVKMLVGTRQGIPVQKMHLGLTLSNLLTQNHLAQGSYLLIQAPPEVQASWDWSNWGFNLDTGLIVHRDSQEALPLNHLMLSVSEYVED